MSPASGDLSILDGMQIILVDLIFHLIPSCSLIGSFKFSH